MDEWSVDPDEVEVVAIRKVEAAEGDADWRCAHCGDGIYPDDAYWVSFRDLRDERRAPYAMAVCVRCAVLFRGDSTEPRLEARRRPAPWDDDTAVVESVQGWPEDLTGAAGTWPCEVCGRDFQKQLTWRVTVSVNEQTTNWTVCPQCARQASHRIIGESRDRDKD